MKIRHQLDAPQIEEEVKTRLRDNRWIPAIVMSVVVLAAVRACNKSVTINIHNYESEVKN